MKFEFSAGAIVYTNKNDRRYFLGLKRKEGWLDFPKGHIEKGENARGAAIREIKEESGLDVKLDPYFRTDISYWFISKEKEKIKKKVTVFLAEADPNARVKVSFEHVGFEWVAMEEAKEKLAFKNQLGPIRDANEYLDRIGLMKDLNKEYSELPKGHKSWGLSGRFVPGIGPLNAKVMIVGQAPGRNEDIQGEPFVGMAGKLLNELLRRAGLRREEVYICSIVQFFPPDNRLPTEEEAMHCMPFLRRQITIVKPKLVVALGNFSAENLVGVGNVMTNHGRLVKSKEFDCDVFVTLHPAAAVRIRTNIPTIEKDFERLGRIVRDLG